MYFKQNNILCKNRPTPKLYYLLRVGLYSIHVFINRNVNAIIAIQIRFYINCQDRLLD